MLFNSYPFLFIFLPVCLVGFFILGRLWHAGSVIWIAAASLVFYAVSGPWFLAVLVISILFNYTAGRSVIAAGTKGHKRAAAMATGGAIVADLGVLGYFKYADFFSTNLNAALGLPAPVWTIVLPIGISFYTFTQIAFLVDAYKGKVTSTGLREYVLFVSYFPHLIAGPILHHAEMIPQFVNRQTSRLNSRNIAMGLAMLVVGLGKKLIMADSLAPFADAVFGPAASGPLSFGDAWAGALAYTLQIYFDFSGYCDMAIGISLLFNVQLPLNFYSPYKSQSIIEFWRRWHMTLSRFLRDYLYIALGGNRRGPVRRYGNLVLTMLLGGLWHGAAWTFVAWGAVHGFYLLINHAYRGKWASANADSRWFQIGAGTLTFACVVVAWVFFRASSLSDAIHILRAMAGFGVGRNLALPDLAEEPRWLELWVGLGLVICWLAPNTQQIFSLTFHPGVSSGKSIVREERSWLSERMRWRPTLATAVAIGTLAAVSVLLFVRTTRFLYFQF